MKLKHLSKEFEYFTPKWLIFLPIQLELESYLISLFNIWTNTVQNMYQYINKYGYYEYFLISRDFSHGILRIFTIKIAIFFTYSALHHGSYR